MLVLKNSMNGIAPIISVLEAVIIIDTKLKSISKII